MDNRQKILKNIKEVVSFFELQEEKDFQQKLNVKLVQKVLQNEII
jgi:hypothetical protein